MTEYAILQKHQQLYRILLLLTGVLKKVFIPIWRENHKKIMII